MTTWTTRDGQTLPIRSMDDRHLLNAFRLVMWSLRHKAMQLAFRADRYSCSAPDGAAECASREACFLYELADDEHGHQETLNVFADEPLGIQGQAMLDEIERRGLSIQT